MTDAVLTMGLGFAVVWAFVMLVGGSLVVANVFVPASDRRWWHIALASVGAVIVAGCLSVLVALLR